MRQSDIGTFFVSIWGSSWAILEPSWAPQGGGKGAQVGAKTDQNRRRKRRCNKKVFKIVLGRSWSRLGAILGPSWPHLRPSWDDFEASGGSWGALRGVRGRLGAILEVILWQHDFRTFFGSILVSFWAPQGGGQKEPKLEPKRSKIEDEKAHAKRSS